MSVTDPVVPYAVTIGDDVIADLRNRLGGTRWPDEELVDDWSQGVPLAYVRELCGHWRDGYEMRRIADRLNARPQFRTRIEGLDVHFLHVRSEHADATPLILTHGWPGSVLEFLDVIDPLVDPTAHGGRPSDAFHVVIPSLPGYGFSAKPTAPGFGVERIAQAWTQLMTRLGYERFGAQGGDWGSYVTQMLALEHPERLLGIHLNSARADPEALAALGALTEQEETDIAAAAAFALHGRGYAIQQQTRPQTLGYGLADSPAGQCAWIVEKLCAWSDCDGHPENAFSRDAILDDVMVYWLNGAATSSGRLYWESGTAAFAGYRPIAVPAAYSVFPREILRLSERWARTRFADLRYYHRVDRGGHFAAFEQPERFVAEVRAGFDAMLGADR